MRFRISDLLLLTFIVALVALLVRGYQDLVQLQKVAAITRAETAAMASEVAAIQRQLEAAQPRRDYLQQLW